MIASFSKCSQCRLRLAYVSQDLIFFHWALLNADRTASHRFVYAESALYFWTSTNPIEKLFQLLSRRLQAKCLYSFESKGSELVCDDDCLLSASPAALTRLCIDSASSSSREKSNPAAVWYLSGAHSIPYTWNSFIHLLAQMVYINP